MQRMFVLRYGCSLYRFLDLKVSCIGRTSWRDCNCNARAIVLNVVNHILSGISGPNTAIRMNDRIGQIERRAEPGTVAG